MKQKRSCIVRKINKRRNKKRNTSPLMKRKLMDGSAMEHGLGIRVCHAGIEETLPGLSLGRRMDNGNEWEWIELERAMCNMQNSKQFMCSGLRGSHQPQEEERTAT